MKRAFAVRPPLPRRGHSANNDQAGNRGNGTTGAFGAPALAVLDLGSQVSRHAPAPAYRLWAIGYYPRVRVLSHRPLNTTMEPYHEQDAQ